MRPATMILALALVLAACTTADGASSSTATTVAVETSTDEPSEPTSETTEVSRATTTITTAPTTTTTVSPFARPDWLGTRVLPLRDDGFGEVQPTPSELGPRAFQTLDLLAAPAGTGFEATIEPVPDNVVARSTWRDECPVALDQLRYLSIVHWGFDGDRHTGEMIVNVEVAEDVVWVFEQLYDAGFPIEQMRVIALEELDAPPTGDFNDTTSFVCRPVVNSSSAWSQHAYGLAVDINPFHNPYEKGDLVLPELASYYLDRTRAEPGMVVEGDIVTQAFAELGWGWGGNWNTLDDFMHFSRNGL